jgi:hypothetical protein
MPLPLRFVKEIHARLAVRYGSAWVSKWAGVDQEAIEADWAEQLAGMEPAEIKKALAALPHDFPPTAPAFRALGLIREEHKPAALLPAPDKAGLARIAKAMATGLQRQDVPLTTRAKECLDNLRAKVKAGTATIGQRDFLKRAEAGLGLESDIKQVGGFTPIPRDRWPTGMQAEEVGRPLPSAHVEPANV